MSKIKGCNARVANNDVQLNGAIVKIIACEQPVRSNTATCEQITTQVWAAEGVAELKPVNLALH
jgi:hypothetical protein